ncbi:MAG TPA: hypothetical protein DCS07_01050 [Bdellovibrionales bacterium]|nr:MAG: hypothetical protein A2X97_01515 [Bdellovibrionales bacterium GWA1_52_35]OFZ33064.1 MAG: hypothetical protein A2070_08185 [Bdellovibrionales bacterium GWC1_52_8]HAR41214.1 hypothetical protein [Bdellovibrionales bacterium]HCM39382.1 hypothetical protein [Bdellovibrionales bacterium]
MQGSVNPFEIKSSLKRYPFSKKDLLQAWDSADELLLEHLSSLDLRDKSILILEDQFGALSCALECLNPVTYSDSYVSCRATALNSEGRILATSDLSKLTGLFDLVLMRIPRNMSYFEDLLCRLSHLLQPSSQVICTYMIKHQANLSFQLLEKLIGPTRTSLAKKKARLIFAQFQRSPTPSPFPLHISFPNFSIPFVNHSNLFSREGLDVGTRFLLEHIPSGNYKTILDLGCANGIIGIKAKQLNSATKIICTDDSSMAIQSAHTNYRNYFPDEGQFVWTNCYEDQEPESIDLVICNPPFHQGNTLSDRVALQMFANSKKVLVRGGTLRVIGNRHLQYPGILKRIFGNSQIVATNSKFVIVDACKSV